MSTPAGEQGWPKDYPYVENEFKTARNDAMSLIALANGCVAPPCNRRTCVCGNAADALASAKMLRPPAGVDDEEIKEIARQYEGARESIAKIQEYRTYPGEIVAGEYVLKHFDNFRRANDAIGVLLRSRHTAVTAAGVDTVGHTDVRVTAKELETWIAAWTTKYLGASRLLPEQPEWLAGDLIDQFNVTRK